MIRLVAAGLLCLLALPAAAQRVRVVHASPDAPPVDIYVDGQIALTGIPYGEYTDYVDIPAGQRELAIFVAGTSTRVIQVSPYLSPGVDYTVIALGFAGGKAPAFRILLLADTGADPQPDFAKLRVIHGAASAPAVDVYLTKPFLALRNLIPVLTGVPFAAASSYLNVPVQEPAQFQARVTLAGTKTVAIDSGRLVLRPGEVRTVIALDNPGGGAPFRLLVLLDRN